MAFKFVILASVLAYANAGLVAAPAAFSYAAPALSYAAPVAIHAPAIGSSHQSVVRSPLGNSAVSTYSKAVDTAFSSVRKFDTRVTNDALAVAHTPVIAHAPVAVAHAAPLAVAHAPIATAYAAPAAVVSHVAFDGIGAHYAW